MKAGNVSHRPVVGSVVAAASVFSVASAAQNKSNAAGQDLRQYNLCASHPSCSEALAQSIAADAWNGWQMQADSGAMPCNESMRDPAGCHVMICAPPGGANRVVYWRDQQGCKRQPYSPSNPA